MTARTIALAGYDIAGVAACDYGHVLTLSNGCGDFIVVEAATVGTDLNGAGRFVADFGAEATHLRTFHGFAAGTAATLRAALDFATQYALSHIEF